MKNKMKKRARREINEWIVVGLIGNVNQKFDFSGAQGRFDSSSQGSETFSGSDGSWFVS